MDTPRQPVPVRANYIRHKGIRLDRVTVNRVRLSYDQHARSHVFLQERTRNLGGTTESESLFVPSRDGKAFFLSYRCVVALLSQRRFILWWTKQNYKHR